MLRGQPRRPRHRSSQIYDCARKLFGEGSKKGRAWAKKYSDILRKKGPALLLAELQRLSEQSWDEEAEKRLTNLLAYVTRHQKRMRYPLFRRLGLPIATGAIESANRQVVGDRCKRSGMGWSKASLQALLSLRAALVSDNWNRVSAAIRKHRSCRPEPRPARSVNTLPCEPDNPRPALGERASEGKPVRTRTQRRPLVSERTQAKKLASGLLRQTEDGLVIGSVAS